MKKGFIIVTAVIAAAAVLFYGVRYLSRPVNIYPLEISTTEDSVSTRAFIIHDSVVYTADRSGTVYYMFSEGDRVAANVLIATLYSGDADNDTLNELNVINKKIAKIKSAENYSSTVYSSDPASVENAVESKRLSMIEYGFDNDVSAISQLKSDINSLRAGDYTEDDRLEELEEQKSAIEKKIGGVSKEIYTEQSGVFTTFLDGLENSLTIDRIKQMSPSDFNSISNVRAEATDISVVSGENMFKTVNNHVWYVAAVVDSETADKCEESSKLSLRFAAIPGDDIQASVYYRSETDENGDVIIAFACSRYVEGAYSIRTGDMSIIFDSYTGYKIPSSAVTENDGVTGVWAKLDNKDDFYECDVLFETGDGYSVVVPSEDAKNQLSKADAVTLDYTAALLE